MNNEINEISEALKKGWTDDVKEQKAYMQKLGVFKAKINELKSEAEKAYLFKLKEFTEALVNSNSLKAHEYRDIRDAYLAKELGEKETLDRLSSTIAAQLDGLKSVLYLTAHQTLAEVWD